MREKKRKDFRDIFGEDAFYDKTAEQTLQAGSIRQSMNDEDKKDINAAEDYCNTYLFGTILKETDDDQQIWRYLSWWYFAAEEPLDPKASTEEYIKQCFAACKKRVKYWEEDLTRFKRVVRGSLLILQDPDLDLEGHKFVTMLRAWRILWGISDDNVQPTLRQVHNKLVEGLVKLSKDDDLLVKYLDALKATQRVEDDEDEDEETSGDEKKKQGSGSSWFVPAAIATATAVAVLGAVFYFRNKWRKQ